MKLSVGAAMAVTLWATAAQTQVLPSGPGTSIPLSPDDRPLLSRPSNHSFIETGLGAGTPGPFLPNPNDPTRFPILGMFPFGEE
jgi:hypothetical protein